MSVVRTLFLACVSLVLGQLALPERASAETGVCAANAVVQFEHASHPTALGGRALLQDGSAHRLAATALAAARSAFHARSRDVGDDGEHRSFHVAARAAFSLPPARAPPLDS